MGILRSGSGRIGGNRLSFGNRFSPIDLSNLAVWLDASAESSVQRVGDVVYRWGDLSENGYDAYQSSEAAKPSYDETNKCIVFDGDDLDFFPKDVKVMCFVVSNIKGKSFNAFEIGIISNAGGSITLYKENKTANLGSGFVGKMTVNDGTAVTGGDVIITDPTGYTTFPWESTNKSLLTFEFDSATSSIIKIMQQRPSYLDGKGSIHEIVGLENSDDIEKVKKYFISKWGCS